MQLKPVFLVICAVTGIGLVVLSNLFYYYMIGEVNGRSGPGEQLRVIAANTQYFKLLRRHRGLFRDSRLRVAAITTHICGLILFFGAFVGGVIINN